MKKVLRWAAYGFAGLIGLVLVLGTIGFFVGKSRVERTYDVQPRVTSLPTDSASLALGARIAQTRGCADCHGANLGGQVFLDIPPGLIVAPNLTRGAGGVGGNYGDADWDRAVRYGVRPNGEGLLPFMPYMLFHNLNDNDMAALAAYLESVPPIDNELPPTKLRLPGYLMLASPDMSPSKLRASLDEPPPAVIPAGPTPEYGRYIANTVCVECHGPDLRGGVASGHGPPPGPSLASYGSMPIDAFAKALREGVAPGGRQLSADMPWKMFSAFTDEEVAALHAYLKTM